MVIAILLASSGYALKVYDYECDKSGKATITFEGTDEDPIYTKDMNVTYNNIQLNGSWGNKEIRKSSDREEQYVDFTTDEAIFNSTKTYKIKVNYTEETQDKILNYDITCPGLFFSCTQLNTRIIDCYNKDNKFVAEFAIGGIDNQGYGKIFDVDENMEYYLNTKENYFDTNNLKSKRGYLPNGTKVMKKSDGIYYVEYKFPEANEVERFSLAYVRDGYNNKCFDIDSLKLSDSKTCRVLVEESNVDEQGTEEVILKGETNKDYTAYWVLLISFLIVMAIFIIIRLRMNKRL